MDRLKEVVCELLFDKSEYKSESEINRYHFLHEREFDNFSEELLNNNLVMRSSLALLLERQQEVINDLLSSTLDPPYDKDLETLFNAYNIVCNDISKKLIKESYDK